MVMLYGTGCSHGRHDRMCGPHALGYSLLDFSGSLFRHQFYDVVQEAARQRHLFFLGCGQVTIVLIRPRLLSEIHHH